LTERNQTFIMLNILMLQLLMVLTCLAYFQLS